MAALSQHLFQRLGLRYGAGETVEDDARMLLAETVVDRGEDVHHQFVGDEFALVNESFGCLAQFCAVFDLVAQHITGGDVFQSVLLNQLVALGAFAGTRCTKNYDILHFLLFVK